MLAGMNPFLKRLGRALADIVTSKKAIATIVGVVFAAAGQPQIGGLIAAYVLAQGVADHGKEAEKKKAWLASDAELAAKLKVIRDAQQP